MYTIYTYDPDTGELESKMENIHETVRLPLVHSLHGLGYLVKVQDQQDGNIVQTLG